MHDQACYTHTHIVRHRYKRGRHTRTHTVFHTQYNMHIATTTTKQHHVQCKPHVDVQAKIGHAPMPFHQLALRRCKQSAQQRLAWQHEGELYVQLHLP